MKIDDPKRSVEGLVEIMYNYCEEYPNDPKNVVQPEITFEIKLTDTDIFRGRIDGVIRLSDGSPALLEDKTASVLGKTFFEKLKLSYQILWYMWVAEKMGLFDVGKRTAPKCLMNALYIHPTEYRFPRDILIKSRSNLENAHQDLLRWIAYIKACTELNFFPRNTDRCKDWGGCTYRVLSDCDDKLKNRILSAEFKDRVDIDDQEIVELDASS